MPATSSFPVVSGCLGAGSAMIVTRVELGVYFATFLLLPLTDSMRKLNVVPFNVRSSSNSFGKTSIAISIIDLVS